MLLQSNLGYINILPVLPDQWETGLFDGLVARGNVIVDVSWNIKKLTQVRLHPKLDGELVVQGDGITKAKITDKSGNEVEFSVVGDNRIAFNGLGNEIYTISKFTNNPQRVIDYF